MPGTCLSSLGSLSTSSPPAALRAQAHQATSPLMQQRLQLRAKQFQGFRASSVSYHKWECLQVDTTSTWTKQSLKLAGDSLNKPGSKSQRNWLASFASLQTDGCCALAGLPGTRAVLPSRFRNTFRAGSTRSRVGVRCFALAPLHFCARTFRVRSKSASVSRVLPMTYIAQPRVLQCW